MFSYYNLDAIPIILDIFKVKNIVLTGELNKKTQTIIFDYCEYNAIPHILFNSKENILDKLSEYNNYSAIFLNDDANWYTIYNELKIIQRTNNEFPLVFICNNNFPNKRRDSYKDPNIIPKNFRNKYSDQIIHENIKINDGFFHAIYENTEKNGVLTAIEDFLKNNAPINIMNIKLINGMTILYQDNSISQIRLGLLSEKIKKYEVEQDYLIEYNIASKYMLDFGISEYEKIAKELKQKNDTNKNIIQDYKNRIKLHNNEIDYKNSQIESFNSKLNLKNSEISSMESQAINRENKIKKLNAELKASKKEVSSLKTDLKNKEIQYTNQIQNAKTKIKENENKLKNKNEKIEFMENEIKYAKKELNKNQNCLNSIKKQNIKQLSELNKNKYCISCYEEKISNKHLEIKYLKTNFFTKKILLPFIYIYLILKSNPKELFLNYKLYNVLKNSECFDIGFYLNNNIDLQEGKWFEYLPLELHYVCNGFNEKRSFNKKFYNKKTKKELLEYLLKYNH